MKEKETKFSYTPEYLIEAYINGNISHVRGILKKKRKKTEVLLQAQEMLSKEDYKRFIELMDL